jgi:glutamyl-tRNA synthetase
MTNINKKVKVRFPPSPTGEIHIGNMRTMLFNYLFAKKNNGEIVFRFEDTDKERSKKEFEEPMLQAYRDFGLSWGDGPYRQSDRSEIYNKYLKLLVESGLAYEAEENKKDGTKVVRLKNKERDIVWNDLVKGEIKINTHTFKGRDENGNFSEEGNPDIIIARNINDAIYHFTVVVDDWLMGVTHVIRGEEHITSTPRQIMILEALRDLQDKNSPEVIIPEYAHLPIIVGADRKKLSKRTGTTSLKAFFDMGYLRETMINYLALLGWNPGDQREYFTLEELINEFSLERVQVSPAQFDFKKLDSINKYYLAKMSEDKFVANCLDYFTDEEKGLINNNFETNKNVILKVLRERVSKASEVAASYRAGEVHMFFKVLWDFDFKNFDLNKICFKGQTLDEAKNNLKLVLEKIENIAPENWTVENLKNTIWDWSATVGRGQVLHPLRMIMSLKDKSPDPFTIMEIVGQEESLRRIKNIL